MPASLPVKSPLLVVVTGLPCTGKTSVSRRLAQELRLPLIAKDDIKESLFDNLGWSDRAWSMKLGKASQLLLYQLVETLLVAGVSAITESAFHPGMAQEAFLEMQQRTPFRPFVIECAADGELTWQRWQQRCLSGERHPGHVDHGSSQEAEARLRPGILQPLQLGGEMRLVRTDDFHQIDFDGLVREIRQLL